MKTLKDGPSFLALTKNDRAIFFRLSHRMTMHFLEWLKGQGEGKSRFRTITLGTKRWVFMVIHDDGEL